MGVVAQWLITVLLVINIQADADQLFLDRYTVIQNFLNQYLRPFTLIEVDPNPSTVFSPTIAQNYTSTCLIFGSHNYAELAQRALQNKYDNLLIGFQSNAKPFFERLTECEHFDVVLIPELNNSPQKIDNELFNLYAKLGEHILIECVCAKDVLVPHKYIVDDKTLKYLASVKRENNQQSIFYYCYYPRRELVRRRWGAHYSSKRFYHITATFDSKTFRKRKIKQDIPWHHGINLNTFAKLHGVYPDKKHVVDQIRSFVGVAHGDLALWNMIIQGNKVILIDWDRVKILDPSIDNIIAKFLRVVDSRRL